MQLKFKFDQSFFLDTFGFT